MQKESKHRMPHHMKLVLIIIACTAALILLYIVVPCGTAGNIFIGTATGLISGLVLMWISSVKSSDERVLEASYEQLTKLFVAIRNTTKVSDEFYHMTYRGKAEAMAEPDYRKMFFSQKEAAGKSLEQIKKFNADGLNIKWLHKNGIEISDLLHQIGEYQQDVDAVYCKILEIQDPKKADYHKHQQLFLALSKDDPIGPFGSEVMKCSDQINDALLRLRHSVV